MGSRYVAFRLGRALSSRTGWLKRKFPTGPPAKTFISLEDWRKTAPPFFFEDRSCLALPKQPANALFQGAADLSAGRIPFFSAQSIDLGPDYDWLTNPRTGYRYNARKHWTRIADLSASAGDIKYVWEKSRFAYLYTIIRADHHHGTDHSAFVFDEICDWIAANPVNCGPNYRCSQEISLRVLNWTFALYFYRRADALTEAVFQRILNAIYWQLHHVYQNINFSRIAVRNNHAITETLTLYLGGLLYPFFPASKTWKAKGKAWFEEEIAYQIYEDGTFLQFSHNYHRVVVQLLSWALFLSERHEEEWGAIVYERAKASLRYLSACMAGTDGELPNYGANDGAWFFPLSSSAYRDYRPQLNALFFFFNRKHLYPEQALQEEAVWYSGALSSIPPKSGPVEQRAEPLSAFPVGGYYLIREDKSLSFIKCGSYKDRPSHADNLHLDIWYEGENVLRDSGTYLYNTTPELLRYFNGTAAHNTVGLGPHDQMQKGPRFIWLHWSQAEHARLYEEEEAYTFQGCIRAFRQLGEHIRHERSVRKVKNKPHWSITDHVSHRTGLPMRQYWHPSPEFFAHFKIEAEDEAGQPLLAKEEEGFYSSHYGVKVAAPMLVFETFTHTIRTQIYPL